MSRTASYGNSDTLGNTMGATWVANLTALPGSTASDVQAAARADADNEIDAALDGVYPVPFADIDDATPTPPIIQTVSNHLTVFYLVIRRQAQGIDAEQYRNVADMWLNRLRPNEDGSREYTIPGVDPVEGDEAKMGVSFKRDAQDSEFAGYDPDNSDDDWMRDW